MAKAKSKARKCVCCGKSYVYNRRDEAPYRRMYCSENCKGIFKTVSDFVFGKIDATKAKAELKSFDLSGVDEFTTDIKEVIEELNGKKKKVEEKEDSNE